MRKKVLSMAIATAALAFSILTETTAEAKTPPQKILRRLNPST